MKRIMKKKKIDYRVVVLTLLIFTVVYSSFNNLEEEKLTGEASLSSKGSCACPFSDIIENNCPTGKVSANSCNRGGCVGIWNKMVYRSSCLFGGTKKEHKPEECAVKCPSAPADYVKLNDCGNKIFNGDVDTKICESDVCLYEKSNSEGGPSEYKQYKCTGDGGWVDNVQESSNSNTITGMQIEKGDGEDEKVCSCSCPAGFEIVIDNCEGSSTCDNTCTCKKEEGEGEEKKITVKLRSCRFSTPFDPSTCKPCPVPKDGWATIAECPSGSGISSCGYCMHVKVNTIKKTKMKIESFSCYKL